jgi:hypothetical protein
MAKKRFNKFGLKRDLNLSDVPNKTQALNNLLSGLATGTETFTTEDLNVIRDINLTDVTNSTFESVSNITVKKLTSNGQLRTYDPLITLSNRFDKAYFTTANPFFYGGDGLDASYYDTEAIIRTTPGDASSDFTGLNSNLVLKSDNEWGYGNFLFGSRFTAETTTSFGAVQWEGYIKPFVDGNHTLLIRTNCFLKVEFDDKTESRGFTYDPSTDTYDYNNYDFTKLTTLVDKTKLDQSSDLETAVISGTSQLLGINETTSVSLGSLVAWEAYKIRITLFVDQESVPENRFIDKNIDFNFIPPSSSVELNINYKLLYGKEYFQNYDIGDFKEFVDNSIGVGGTEVGLKGTIGDVQGTFGSQTPGIGDSYSNVNNVNPIISYYKFPNSRADVETVISGCNITSDVDTISISNNSPSSTEGIEIGNYVFGPGIQSGTRVITVVVNNSIQIYPSPTQTTTNADLTFVDHRGLVAYGTGDVYENRIDTITNDFNLTDIKENQIVLSDGLSFVYNDSIANSITPVSTPVVGRLSSEYDGTTISLKDSNTTLIGNQLFYVYETTGLVDNGLKNFCQGVLKARLLASQTDTTSNSVDILLDDVTGITTNMFVHAFPSVNFDQRLDGTADELYSRVQVTNINGNTLTITGIGGIPALLSGLEYNPAKIKNIVFTATDVNREICFKPTDTSPPFSANASGLTTPFNVSLVNDFTSNGGGVLNNDSKVTYSALEIKHDTNVAGNVITYSNENVTEYLPIEDVEGNNFYILLGS